MDDLTWIEKKLILALGLTDIHQLDALLDAPISIDAAVHAQAPDEIYVLADRLYAEADRHRDARARFEALHTCRYIN